MNSYQTYTDVELLELLKGDDDLAFTTIYERYFIALIDFAETKLYSQEDARDLIQDLFVRLWSERHGLQIKDNFEGYLFTAVRYRVISLIRKNVVRESYAARLRQLSVAFQSLEEELNARELASRMNHTLTQLPGKTQQIYRLSREDNKSVQQIADELELSSKTVKNHISIALKHLRSAISGFFWFL